MKFSPEVLQTIRNRVDMVALVGEYTRLERRGDRWWGLSPFKAEKTPSFTVQPERGFYYCFATQQGGDIFRFISEMEGVPFPEAVTMLAQRAGIDLEQREPTQEERDAASLRELNRRVSGTFRWIMEHSDAAEHARRYLGERGVSAELAAHFSIGYAPADPAWLGQFLRRHGYGSDFLARSGLFGRNGPSWALFRNRIIFPIVDANGTVVGFGGRALDADARAKYVNSPDTALFSKKTTLYGLRQAVDSVRRERTVIVAEGYFDVIALHAADITNSVAPLGTAFTIEQARLLKRWAETIILLFDSDEAGLAATLRAAATAEQAGLDAFAVGVPSGKDPADLYLRDGVAAVQTMVASRVPVFEFLLERFAASLPAGTPVETLLPKLFQYITIVSSEVRRERLLRLLGDRLGISTGATKADFERWQRGDRPRQLEPATGQPIQPSMSRDLSLVLAAAMDGGFFARLRSAVDADDLDDETARRLFLRAEDAYRHEARLPAGLVDRLEDDSLREFVLGRVTSGEFDSWDAPAIDAAIRGVEQRRFQRRQRDLEVEIRRRAAAGEEIRALLEEKMTVDRELDRLRVMTND